MFQGVRGARVKITSSSPPAEMSSSSLMRDAFHNTTRSLQRLFIRGTDQPLSTIMSRRNDLYSQIADLDHQINLHVSSTRQLEVLQASIHKNTEIIELYTSIIHSSNDSKSQENIRTYCLALAQANSKMTSLVEELKKNKIDSKLFESQRTELEKECAKFSLLLEVSEKSK